MKNRGDLKPPRSKLEKRWDRKQRSKKQNKKR